MNPQVMLCAFKHRFVVKISTVYCIQCALLSWLIDQLILSFIHSTGKAEGEGSARGARASRHG